MFGLDMVGYHIKLPKTSGQSQGHGEGALSITLWTQLIALHRCHYGACSLKSRVFDWWYCKGV